MINATSEKLKEKIDTGRKRHRCAGYGTGAVIDSYSRVPFSISPYLTIGIQFKLFWPWVFV